MAEEDITIHELGESFNHTFAYLEIYVDGSHNLTEIRELKAQILENQKNAEKWKKWQEDLHDLAAENKTPYYLMLKENKQLKEKYDKILSSNTGVVFKENQNLKEDLENTINQLTLRNDSADNLKEDVERWKKNFDHCHLLLTKEQQKLEKLKMFLAQYTIDEGEIIKVDVIKLKKILGENKKNE